MKTGVDNGNQKGFAKGDTRTRCRMELHTAVAKRSFRQELKEKVAEGGPSDERAENGKKSSFPSSSVKLFLVSVLRNLHFLAF